MSARCPYCGNKKPDSRPTCDAILCVDEDVRTFSLNYGDKEHEIVGPSMTVESFGRTKGISYPRMAKRHFSEDDRANSISP